MVCNKGIKTGLVPKTAFKKGHSVTEEWKKAFDEGRIGFKKGYTPWNKDLSPEKQPHYKGGRQKTGNGYIQIVMPNHPNADKRGRILEHRYIIEQYLGRPLTRNEYIDHINGDKTDNRIENLRICNQSQNLSNRGKQKNNTSGYKNIFFDKLSNKYYVQIGFENKVYSVGRFTELDKAIEARDKALQKLHGEFAKLD